MMVSQKLKELLIPILLCMYIPNIISLSARFLLYNMVQEKNNKMKETLKLMSLSTYSYGLSYFLFQSIFAILSGMIITFPIFNDRNFFGPIDTHKKSFELTVCTILLYVSAIPFTMTLSTFFSDEKVANNIGSLLIVVPVLLLLQLLQTQSSTRLLIYPLLLLPVTSAGVLFIEIAKSSMIPASMQVFKTFVPVWVAWTFLILATPIWYALYIYFEQIIPQQYGHRRHCCFCLQRNKK